MTTRYEAPVNGLDPKDIVSFSKITRVTAPDGLVDVVVIHHGGELIFRRPFSDHTVTIRDEGDNGHATILAGKEVLLVQQGRNASRTTLGKLGTIEYQGKRMSL